MGLILSVVSYSKIQEINEIAVLSGMSSQLQDDYNGCLALLIMGIIMTVLGLALLVSASSSTQRRYTIEDYNREKYGTIAIGVSAKQKTGLSINSAKFSARGLDHRCEGRR
jgi:hypothetical protein